MPTGNLPESGKNLYEEVYQKALKGSCDGDKECAARTAWKAVKNAGWYKDSEGNWKKKSLTLASMYFTKTSHNKKTGEMLWAATGSDTDEDLAGDNMTLELFSDFLGRIDRDELAPEQFRSEFWKGGLPYLSIAHYPDLDGKGVPGYVDTVYVDGNMLKAKGRFDMTKPLGRKVYDAVRADLYEEKSDEEKIRISIAFLDWMHKHKSNGFEFIRESLDDICPECIKEIIKGEYGGKEFLRGQLVQFALTRIPMNVRTEFGLEAKSMAEEILTRKDDAESIVGEEYADELEELSAEIGKSQALVIKSEDTEEDTDGSEEDNEEGQPEVETQPEEKAEHKKGKKMADEEDEEDEDEEDMKKKKSLASEEIVEPEVVEPDELVQDELDEVYAHFKSNFNEIKNSNLSVDEKLAQLQEPFNAFGDYLISNVKSVATPEEKAEADVLKSIAELLNKELAPIREDIALLKTQASGNVKVPEKPQTVRRSLTPDKVLLEKPAQKKSKGYSIDEIVKMTT